MSDRLELIEKAEIRDAMDAANQEASATYKNVIQVVVFHQGSRICASGSLPIGRAIQMLKTESVAVDKNGNAGLKEVRDAFNRPVDKDHVKAVSNYLCRNVKSKYILPSLTVNAVQLHKIFTTKSDNNAPRVGYLVVDFLSRALTVTDGQHRLHGMMDAINQLRKEERLDDKAKLEQDGISIMFSFESNMGQIHQDFADCSKTKALPKSMIAVYDQRIPVNKLTLDFIEECPLFNDGKVDSASVSLSAKSTAVVLTSNIRSILKAFYCGSPSMADKDFDKMTNDQLDDDKAYQAFFRKTLNYMGILTENNSVLSEITSLPKGPDRQKIPKLRSEFYIASPAGLNLCASLIRDLEMEAKLTQEEINDAVARLASANIWEKSNTIWAGNVITVGKDKNGVQKYAINSTNKALTSAKAKVREKLGIIELQSRLLN